MATQLPRNPRKQGTTMSTSAEEPVERRLEGSVAVLTMRYRPHNLLGPTLMDPLIEGMEWARDNGARAVLLQSGLRHFSAGADLEALSASSRSSGRGGKLLQVFDELPIPVVAGVQGVCVGGGLELALACDIIVAAESAKLGSVEATIGLNPLMGAVQRLTQRAGAARAKEMAMLGRRYDARTLERWGVLNRVVGDEQLAATSMTLAQELAAGPTIAHAATKALVRITVSEGVRAADEAMPDLQKPIFESEDFRSGVSAFKANGRPGTAQFRGR
ncbi:enoyl-CoA hydratase/isomerase family protein [Amycolatopsis sp. NPDC051903]|uniref:enoyl-CoA hydratase/isomerase family protein n=1 Tax=Amycolatopsis sp. NPDC051903 TaxID=3363936 RepID=UPI0037BD8E29